MPAWVGFGAACADDRRRRAKPHAQRALIDGAAAVVDGDPRRRALRRCHRRKARCPHLLCIGVEGVEAEPILLALDQHGVAVHSGSSCSSEMLEPSPVLEAMGVDADHSLRISVGWSTIEADVDRFVEVLPGNRRTLQGVAYRMTVSPSEPCRAVRARRARRPPRSTRRRSTSKSSPRSATARACSSRQPAPRTTTTSGCSRSVRRHRCPERGRVGLYHLAWQVDSIHDLAEMRERLAAARCARRRERPRREQVAVRARSRRQRVRGHVGRPARPTGARPSTTPSSPRSTSTPSSPATADGASYSSGSNRGWKPRGTVRRPGGTFVRLERREQRNDARAELASASRCASPRAAPVEVAVELVDVSGGLGSIEPSRCGRL